MSNSIIIGYVKGMPTIGVPMLMLEFHFFKNGEEYQPSWRTTSKVVAIQTVEDSELLAVVTESGRKYIVEKMES